MNNEREVTLIDILGHTESIKLLFFENKSISELKELLGKKLKANSSDLALFYKNKYLDEDETLQRCNVEYNGLIDYLKLEPFHFSGSMESFNSGDLSKVYLNRSNNIVIKEYTLLGENENHETKEFLSEVISYLKFSYHPNVVKLKGISKKFDSVNKFYIGLEYMDSGNVEKVLLKIGPLNEKRVVEIMKVVVQVLIDMHEKGVIHRGIKGSSIYLNANNEIKLANFGFSKYLDGSNSHERVKGILMSVPKVPTNWLAPEILKEKPEYGKKVDIWGVGVTCIEMISGKKPYDYLSDFEASVAIQKGDRIKYDDSKISAKLKDIITRCTKHEPTDRPSAEELLKLFNK